MTDEDTYADMLAEYESNLLYPYRNFQYTLLNPILYISIVICMVTPLHLVFRRFRVPIGDRLLALILGIAFIWMHHANFFIYINMFRVSMPIHLLTWLIPLWQFRNIFVMELYIVKKARCEIVVIAIVSNLIVVVLSSVSIAKIVLSDYSWKSCFLFGSIISVVEGCDSLRKVKEMERNKHVLIILETEVLVAFSVFLTCFHMVMLSYEGYLVTWYHYIVFFIRYVLGGIGCGVLMGRISAFILASVYNDSYCAVIVCLCCIYIPYAICEYILLTSGSTTTLIISFYLSIERKKLTGAAVDLIRTYMDVLLYATSMTVFVSVISRLGYAVLYFYPIGELISVPFTYCYMVVLRIISLLAVFPFLNRVGYRMDLPSCIFYGWAGATKGPVTLVLAQVALKSVHTQENFHDGLPHVIATVILSLLANYTTYSLLLRKLGFFTMTALRRSNMQNCIDYLNNRKSNLLSILKMSRMMTDTNYPIVYKYTVIQNPYKTIAFDVEEDKMINAQGLRESKCPFCNREVAVQPTKREIFDNLQESKLRLLKTQKVAFIRQYELGMLSKDSVRFLLHLVETAMETEELRVKLEEFYKIFSKKSIYYYAKQVATFLHGVHKSKTPRKKSMIICYNIVNHKVFECFIFVLIICAIIPLILRLCSPKLYSVAKYHRIPLRVTLLVLFTGEIVLKIYAYSVDGLLEGIRIYFRSKWHILDFVVVLVHFVTVVLGLSLQWDDSDEGYITFNIFMVNFNDTFKVLRLFRMLRFISAWWIHRCNVKINQRITFGYDIGKVIIITYLDLSESISQITENPEIMAILKGQLDKDRDMVNITLEDVVKLKPSVPVQVKTAQAIRATLNHMRTAVNELQSLGHVDNMEYSQLMAALYERNRASKALGKIKSSSPRTIFMELPFICEEDSVSEKLFSVGEILNFETNSIVVKDLDEPIGLMVLLQGVLRITYIPHQRVVDDLSYCGVLPVVDFLSPFRSDVPAEEFIFPGNSFGELSLITQRRYNCRIQADTKSRAMHFKNNIMLEALQKNCDPVQGLRSRLWKYVAMDFTAAILRNTQGYQNLSVEQIRMIVDRSFVPNLEHYRTFLVTDLMEDIILIEGLVMDIKNNDVYVAPCYLPRTVQKLSFVECSTMQVKVHPKLLIIPMKDVDEYDIMEREEDMAELIATPPSHLSVHQYRKKKLKKKKKAAGGLIGMSKKRRNESSLLSAARSRTASLGKGLKQTSSSRSNTDYDAMSTTSSAEDSERDTTTISSPEYASLKMQESFQKIQLIETFPNYSTMEMQEIIGDIINRAIFEAEDYEQTMVLLGKSKSYVSAAEELEKSEHIGRVYRKNIPGFIASEAVFTATSHLRDSLDTIHIINVHDDRMTQLHDLEHEDGQVTSEVDLNDLDAVMNRDTFVKSTNGPGYITPEHHYGALYTALEKVEAQQMIEEPFSNKEELMQLTASSFDDRSSSRSSSEHEGTSTQSVTNKSDVVYLFDTEEYLQAKSSSSTLSIDREEYVRDILESIMDNVPPETRKSGKSWSCIKGKKKKAQDTARRNRQIAERRARYADKLKQHTELPTREQLDAVMPFIDTLIENAMSKIMKNEEDMQVTPQNVEEPDPNLLVPIKSKALSKDQKEHYFTTPIGKKPMYDRMMHRHSLTPYGTSKPSGSIRMLSASHQSIADSSVRQLHHPATTSTSTLEHYPASTSQLEQLPATTSSTRRLEHNPARTSSTRTVEHYTATRTRLEQFPATTSSTRTVEHYPATTSSTRTVEHYPATRSRLEQFPATTSSTGTVEHYPATRSRLEQLPATTSSERMLERGRFSKIHTTESQYGTNRPHPLGSDHGSLAHIIICKCVDCKEKHKYKEESLELGKVITQQSQTRSLDTNLIVRSSVRSILKRKMKYNERKEQSDIVLRERKPSKNIQPLEYILPVVHGKEYKSELEADDFIQSRTQSEHVKSLEHILEDNTKESQTPQTSTVALVLDDEDAPEFYNVTQLTIETEQHDVLSSNEEVPEQQPQYDDLYMERHSHTTEVETIDMTPLEEQPVYAESMISNMAEDSEQNIISSKGSFEDMEATADKAMKPSEDPSIATGTIIAGTIVTEKKQYPKVITAHDKMRRVVIEDKACCLKLSKLCRVNEELEVEYQTQLLTDQNKPMDDYEIYKLLLQGRQKADSKDDALVAKKKQKSVELNEKDVNRYTEDKSLDNIIDIESTQHLEEISMDAVSAILTERRKSLEPYKDLASQVQIDTSPSLSQMEFISDDDARQMYAELAKRRTQNRTENRKIGRSQDTVVKDIRCRGAEESIIDLETDRRKYKLQFTDIGRHYSISGNISDNISQIVLRKYKQLNNYGESHETVESLDTEKLQTYKKKVHTREKRHDQIDQTEEAKPIETEATRKQTFSDLPKLVVSTEVQGILHPSGEYSSQATNEKTDPLPSSNATDMGFKYIKGVDQETHTLTFEKKDEIDDMPILSESVKKHLRDDTTYKQSGVTRKQKREEYEKDSTSIQSASSRRSRREKKEKDTMSIESGSRKPRRDKYDDIDVSSKISESSSTTMRKRRMDKRNRIESKRRSDKKSTTSVQSSTRPSNRKSEVIFSKQSDEQINRIQSDNVKEPERKPRKRQYMDRSAVSEQDNTSDAISIASKSSQMRHKDKTVIGLPPIRDRKLPTTDQLARDRKIVKQDFTSFDSLELDVAERDTTKVIKSSQTPQKFPSALSKVERSDGPISRRGYNETSLKRTQRQDYSDRTDKNVETVNTGVSTMKPSNEMQLLGKSSSLEISTWDVETPAGSSKGTKADFKLKKEDTQAIPERPDKPKSKGAKLQFAVESSQRFDEDLSSASGYVIAKPKRSSTRFQRDKPP